jgi:hypothetical protein
MPDGTEATYSTEDLTISPRKVVAGQATYATEAIQAVWITKHSELAQLAVIAGLLALMFGGTMMSCGGIFIGAVSGELDNGWSTKAWLTMAAGVALLVGAKHLPPFRFIVNATVGGQHVGIYQTKSIEQAQEIERALTAARGL